MNNPELVCATDIEEFFYEDSEFPVQEGDPVGVDLDYGAEIKLVLFDGIYWEPQNGLFD
jgi:hypothetical protein